MPSITGRTDYNQGRLLEADLDADPIRQFERWFAEAAAAGQVEPNAMTLATATPDGRPSARIVLLREVDTRGFSFFTSYQSRKSSELEANPHAALIFFWAAPGTPGPRRGPRSNASARPSPTPTTPAGPAARS